MAGFAFATASAFSETALKPRPGCVTHPQDVRKILDRVNHPALLMVDTISGLGSLEYEHDAWGIDVSVAGSQKGLMLPPGLGFNAVSEKALAVAKANPAMRSYWDWQEVIAINKAGTWPYTPATNLLFGLREAVKMLEEEGLENVFARHKRHSAATRAADQGVGPGNAMPGAGRAFARADRRRHAGRP